MSDRLPYELRLQIGKALDRIVCDDSTPEQVDTFVQTFAAFGLLVSTAEWAIDPEFLGEFARWNLATFGPGLRTGGTIAHIRKELIEIEADPTDPKEWVDVLLLAINGLTRIGLSPPEIVAAVRAKHAVNQARDWPDWRNHPDTPIEHDRSKDAVAGEERQ